MIIDLRDINIFDEDSIDINKKTCFIFGNNGTGKSTLTNHLKNSLTNYDIRVFQGFDSVVNDNEEMNAVVLGEQNVEIDKEVKNIDYEISQIDTKKSEVERLIDKSNHDEDNLYHKMTSCKIQYEKFDRKIEDFYSQEASRIKNIEPKISKTNYNKNDFKLEIEQANSLSEDEIERLNKLIISEEKIAPTINFPEINPLEILSEVNDLLSKTVEESVKISRLDNNVEKRDFAKKGLQIHKKGDKCSFCGNEISDECFEQLDKYFSAEDIKNFEKQLQDEFNLLTSIKTTIENLDLNINNFYESLHTEFRELELNFNETKSKNLEFLELLRKSISDKQKNLFEKVNELNIIPPKNFEDVNIKYLELSQKNNKSDLGIKKSEAKNRLRFDEVKNSILQYNYSEKLDELTRLKNDYENSKEQLNNVEIEVNKLKSNIEQLRSKKLELKSKSKNEEKLATEINKLLNIYVNFKLIHYKHDQYGYYRIQCKYTDEIRDVKQLSMGEKNIIAFLYFLKKLEEINEQGLVDKKIIVFDDPMTSNDNNMQYIMIEELIKLINKSNKNDNIEQLIIMTHNHHFYLNLTGYLKEKYKKYQFLRFVSNGENTNIRLIKNKDEDFKSNYEALWQDLEFVYISDKGRAGLLCNIARRIVDTFTNFNSISKTKFYSGIAGAKKLFDVNSHEIEDMDADLTGVGKKTIIKILYDCFDKNNSSEHFKKYFTLDVL
ncbi:AAA family ATPase [Streptococcus gallinaceus]|uniref:Nuclease SbcCD subunit C n=1 Tax=Streptococcus gallinaceus TaxID=165758 RepID=A0ABV2JIW7_9STRE